MPISQIRGVLLRSLLALASISATASISQAAPPKKIRVALIVDHPADGAVARHHAGVIGELARGETAFEIAIDDPRGRPRSELNRALADKSIDLIVALGPLGSAELVKQSGLPKPVIAADVYDPEIFGAPKRGESSGVQNLSYVADAGALTRDLTAVRDLGIKKPAILIGRAALSAIGRLGDGVVARARSVGIAATIVPVEAGRTPNVPADADGAVLLLIGELGPDDRRALLDALHQKKLKTYSVAGSDDVRAGAVAGLAHARDRDQRARRVAINVMRLAGGEQASAIPVGYQRAETLTINLSTAAKIGWSPPFEVLAEAETIGEESIATEGPKVTLRSVADEVAAKNLDFEANRHQVDAQNEDEERAVSLLLPKVDVSLRGIALDPRRAEASFGLQPQRQLLAVVEGTGVIFSEKLWANHSVQKRLTTVREAQREAVKLDLILEGATAYLGVLQTQVLERVQVENAKKTRENLGHARGKSAAGAAMPTEVLRWESQLALDRREVLKARSLRRLAEMQLNRLRHRPIEEPFTIAATELDSEMALLAPEALLAYLGDARAFEVFRDFLVEEGLARSPEMKALDEAVLASERVVTSAWASVFVPTFAVQGQLSYYLARGGQGSSAPAVPPGFGPEVTMVLENLFPPEIGPYIWQVGAIASLPIPFDLAPFSDIRRAEAELEQRRTERNSAKEKIEQRIRSAAYRVAASYPGLELARTSAEAARKAIAIAQDAYRTGVLGVLDLLDAQNVALQAEQNAVAAQYEFMVDELNLERAVGTFYFMQEKEERDAWVQRAVEYLEKHR